MSHHAASQRSYRESDPFDHFQLPRGTADLIAEGHGLRESIPLHRQAELSLPQRRDPLGVLEEQNAGRLQELVPLRIERMSQSPFAFYRGTAAIMAADLAGGPHTGVLVASCGDAHISNFGFYASPQRTLVFDLNDFDEAAWAPWEWDLKRLVASIVIGGQASSRDDAAIETAVLHAVMTYASTLRAAVNMSPTKRYFVRLDVERTTDNLDKASQKVLRTAVKQARKRTSERATQKLTTTDDRGRMRFVERQPVMTAPTPEMREVSRQGLHDYMESTNADVRQLMRNYTMSDIARRVVGVGSVGTRCSLALLQDGDGHSLIMQSKEANRSVLEQYGGIAQPEELREHVERNGEGARVVALQRILQAVSDPFLGHLRTPSSDLYVRQFHDMKGGIDTETIDDGPFINYSEACAVMLARAHSQSPEAALASGYAGRRGYRLGMALLEWGWAYAKLSKQDFEDFVAANPAQ